MRKYLLFSFVILTTAIILSVICSVKRKLYIGSGGDYSNLNSAVNDLVNAGVSGPVVFDIISGTYTEQLSIPEIAGTSTINSITFQSQSGNASDVIIQFQPTSSDNYVINLNGTDNLRLKNLTLQSITDPTYRRVILFGRW